MNQHLPNINVVYSLLYNYFLNKVYRHDRKRNRLSHHVFQLKHFLCINPNIYLSIYLSTCLPSCLPACLPTSLPPSLPPSLPTSLPTYLPIYLSIDPSFHPSIFPSIHPSINPSIHALYIYMLYSQGTEIFLARSTVDGVHLGSTQYVRTSFARRHLQSRKFTVE